MQKLMGCCMQYSCKDGYPSQSTISGASDVNQRNIRTIVSGMVSVVDVLEHHNYTMPDYPVKQVELIHVKVKDDDNLFDAFMQAPSSSVPVPGDIYVQRGFFLQVYINTDKSYSYCLYCRLVQL